jgi:sugar phosphate isomerase/epimerase
MYLSMMLSSLPLDFEPAVRQAAALGFTHVDVSAVGDRPPRHLEILAESGLLVSCAAVGRGLPENWALDAPSVETRRLALAEMKGQVADAARLGATHCYVVPGNDASDGGLARFTEACSLLGEFAGRSMVRLCIEHFPGRRLSAARDVLIWLEKIGQANLALLLDVGHCLISREDPVEIIHEAGSALGYVHFDDNDGVGDLHWPLLSGRLTKESMLAIGAALRRTGFPGGLALELNARNPDPVEALRQGKKVLEMLLQDQ